MKTRIKSFLALLIVLVLGTFARAQTAPSPLGGTNTLLAQHVDAAVSPPTASTLTDLLHGGVKQAAKDLVSFIENTTNSGVLTIESGALYAMETKKVGGFLDVYMPIGGTNSVFGAGFGLAYLDHNFYDATLNARVGDTFKLPFIHLPVYAYTEAGGGYNLGKNEVIAQAFAGALFRIPVTKSQTFTIGGALGTISDQKGQILAAGASYTFAW